jgi:hypothetical protein
VEPPVTERRPVAPRQGAGRDFELQNFFSLRIDPAPLPGRKAITTGIPAVPPPANFHRASGAKEKDLGNYKAPS